MERKELSFIDILSIASFVIALQNLDLNITQDDMQATESNLDRSMREQIEDIHRHLAVQDEKLNAIIRRLE